MLAEAHSFLEYLRSRDQIRGQLGKLRQLMDTGELSEEQYRSSSEKYQQEVGQLELQINRLREQAQDTLTILQTTLGSYDAQLRKLQTSLTEGKLSSKEFHAKAMQVQKERSQFLEHKNIPLLEAMVKYTTAADFSVWLEQVSAAFPPSSTGSSWNTISIVLRVLTFLTGIALFFSVLLPIFPKNVLPDMAPGRSLLLLLLGEGTPGILVWPVFGSLIFLGFGQILVSVLPGKVFRGILSLFFGAKGLGLLAVLFSCLLFLPMPGLGLKSVLTVWLFPPPAGMVVVSCALLFAEVLALLHVLKSRMGLLAWGLLFVFVAAFGVWSSIAIHFGAHTSASVLILRDEKGMPASESTSMATFAVLVHNHGNIPMFLRRSLEKDPARTEYALVVEQRSSDAPWKAVMLENLSDQIIPGSETAVVPISLPFGEEKEAVHYRAQLLSSTDSMLVSNELRIELPKKTASDAIPMVVAPPAPVPAPSPTSEESSLSAAQALVDGLKETLTADPSAAVIDRVQEARKAISRLTDFAMQEQLDGELDEAILNAKDTQGELILKSASEALQSNNFVVALERCKALSSLYANPPQAKTLPLSDYAQSLLETSQTVQYQASIASDPSQRFRVSGFVETSPAAPMAFLFDNLTSQSVRVQQGTVLGEWTVTELSNRRVIVKKGEQSWEIR